MVNGISQLENRDWRFKGDILVDGSTFLNPNRFVLTERFNQLPGANGDVGIAYNVDFEVLGTGSDQADATFSSTYGGVQMETDASGSQQLILCPHLNSEQSAWTGVKWGNENQVVWEAVIVTGASIADVIIWGGMKLTMDQDITADNHQAFFRFDGVTANWVTVTTDVNLIPYVGVEGNAKSIVLVSTQISRIIFE